MCKIYDFMSIRKIRIGFEGEERWSWAKINRETINDILLPTSADEISL